MALILLRHQKPKTSEGLCYGQTDLEPEGDPAEIAKTLLPQLPQFTAIVSSPLKRCRLLAQAIATLTDRPLDIEPMLSEIHLGHWENRAWDEIPRSEIDAWAENVLEATPHGGESVADFYERVTPGLRNLIKSPGTILLVAHNGTYKAACRLLGRKDADQATLGYQCFEMLDGLETQLPQP
ncbi:histidine phosphatase family protein [Qingshengfaniella alkalisoli]|uniref:histidine phosphatase family protein n=1 Tax=Qingshengfaniella alkalisoli TaxID=2599296 RepID=UPI00143D6E27|nr:histidine phosphatase family protein [Qingshengfaniella alkalisoli]